jgi:hypothetical protein
MLTAFREDSTLPINLPKTSLKVRHTLSRQPYGKKRRVCGDPMSYTQFVQFSNADIREDLRHYLMIMLSLRYFTYTTPKSVIRYDPWHSHHRLDLRPEPNLKMHVNWVSQRNAKYHTISICSAEIRNRDLQNTKQCPSLQLTWQTDLCHFPNVAVSWCTATSRSGGLVFKSKLWHWIFSLRFLVLCPSHSGQIPGYYLKSFHDRSPSTSFPINYSFADHPTVWRCMVWAIARSL